MATETKLLVEKIKSKYLCAVGRSVRTSYRKLACVALHQSSSRSRWKPRGHYLYCCCVFFVFCINSVAAGWKQSWGKDYDRRLFYYCRTHTHRSWCALIKTRRSVEDMMKRSFSEFRTQRELGAKDLPKVMAKCTDALNNLKATVRTAEPAKCPRIPA